MTHEDSIQELYQLMSTKTTWTDANLIFAITLPLVDEEQFMAYKMTPNPFRNSDNQLKSVTSEADFLVINDHRDRFFTLNTLQMAKCYRLNSNVLVCPKQHMTFSSEAPMWRCYLNLFLNQGGTQCPQCSATWIPLHAPNTWLFATKETANLTALSSFPESKAEKQFFQQNMQLFLSYHRNQISRVYPKGQRLDSSNFNPVPFWNIGSQMIALNYQTGDKAMQLNQSKFRNNGQCGYILKPAFMMLDSFNPNNPLSDGLNEIKVSIRIIAARHLFRGGKSNNPQIVVEICGASFDSGIKYRTKVNENGFHPIWNESCEFIVRNPQLALLRFEVQDEDMFAETHFIAQACYPLNCVRQGYRSVILRNKFSEELELSSLLIHLNTVNVS
ncbi:1-phosphatidylinositol 4,5-bisphosphate phosphodiesterase gamma-1-like [Scaptodrosophila lebanonensis]|uniref:Phosphoinositide phospholipase C n=1 Tax=Drosophila lebanonensis TaxID=7225 RepID=A0A6J2TXX0_DROLE|nr:1-phosphatidylinositol 4,5-bisphosphate phosphodiesterase gamma-1-like [Scaptodrosophila lebanonensis]